ncbi:MAG: hypothetical protein ACE5IO_09935, partial [Thermoplasmata archaeon]
YRGTGFVISQQVTTSCAQVSDLSVTMPEDVGPGSTIVVTVTVGTGIYHTSGECDFLELFISRFPDNCDQYPGYFMTNVATNLPTSYYYSTSTIQRAFYYDVGFTGGEAFYVNAKMSMGCDSSDHLMTGNTVAVYYPD